MFSTVTIKMVVGSLCGYKIGYLKKNLKIMLVLFQTAMLRIPELVGHVGQTLGPQVYEL